MSTDVKGGGISFVNVKVLPGRGQTDVKTLRWEYACDIQGPARAPPRLAGSERG